jgi:hypothetical protein
MNNDLVRLIWLPKLSESDSRVSKLEIQAELSVNSTRLKLRIRISLEASLGLLKASISVHLVLKLSVEVCFLLRSHN